MIYGTYRYTANRVSNYTNNKVLLEVLFNNQIQYTSDTCVCMSNQTMHNACWKARRRPVTADWPYIQAIEMTVPEIITASALLLNARHVGL